MRRLIAVKRDRNLLRLKVPTEQLGEISKCYSIILIKLKGFRYGLLSAIAPAMQEGCTGLSSDSARDF